MSTELITFDIVQDPEKRRAWVVYQLRIRGNSLRKLGRVHNKSISAMSQALVAPSVNCENIIADALSIPVHQLFPERYTPRGRRLVTTRNSKSTTPLEIRHVEKRGAA